MLKKIIQELKLNAGKKRNQEEFSKFFKTGKGEYGEGDVFIGVKVPTQRIIAKKYFQDLKYQEIQKLLDNKIHEYRLTALFILNYKYAKLNPEEKKEIFNFMIKNLKKANNWDLVDTGSAPIVGNYLADNDKKILYKLAVSKNLWERRVAIVATIKFIKNNNFVDTIKISKILLNDQHDLIHKAVGWMLREVGKKEQKVLINFLDQYCRKMPRVMLRYAIEKFDKNTRKKYLNF